MGTCTLLYKGKGSRNDYKANFYSQFRARSLSTPYHHAGNRFSPIPVDSNNHDSWKIAYTWRHPHLTLFPEFYPKFHQAPNVAYLDLKMLSILFTRKPFEKRSKASMHQRFILTKQETCRTKPSGKTSVQVGKRLSPGSAPHLESDTSFVFLSHAPWI